MSIEPNRDGSQTAVPFLSRMNTRPTHTIALIEAFFVNIVWASSFIFVKLALVDMGPLTIGGLRYFIGFLFLLPFLVRRDKFTRVLLTRKLWGRLLLIGVSAYTIGNGALFWSLKFLPATTVSFLMSMITLLIVIGGVVWLKEIPNTVQTIGIFITLIGAGLFFSIGFRPGEPLGMAILSIGLLSFTLFGVLGRDTARDQKVDTLSLTAFPLALGGGIMLLIALPLEGIPNASLATWGMVLWLAAINTALAYVLYNHSLQVLTAFEMNILLNLSPLFTALFSWLLLEERLTGLQLIGMVALVFGVMLVQRRQKLRAR